MNYMKKNLYFNIGALIIGGVALVIALGFLDNSSLFGAGIAFSAVGVVGIFQSLSLMRSPERCSEIELMKTEERSVFIREKISSKVYSIFVYVECAGCLIASILGYRDITLILAFLVAAKLVAWFVVGSKIVKEN